MSRDQPRSQLFATFRLCVHFSLLLLLTAPLLMASLRLRTLAAQLRTRTAL